MEARRVLVISDVHLGDWRFKHMTELGFILKAAAADALILAGDIFDLMKCSKPTSLHVSFLEMTEHIRHKVFVVGNHELPCCKFTPGSYWWDLVSSYGFLIVDSFIFRSGGRRIMVSHGHQFDFIPRYFPRLNWLIVKLQAFIDRLLRTDIQRTLRRLIWSKHQLNGIDKKAIEYAKPLVDIFIMGHTHYPRVVRLDDLLYINSGDWIENKTYVLVENGEAWLKQL